MRLPVIGASTVLALTVAGVGPASAAEDPGEAIADMIATVAPDQGQVVIPESAGEGFAVTTGGLTVEVPAEPDQPVTMTAGDDQSGVSELAVSLPAELDLMSPTVAVDGTLVYPAAEDGQAAAAVQVLDDGSTRIQTIIPDAEAADEFTYTFGLGSRVMQDPEGRIFVERDGQVIGELDTPWAVDATGVALATHYVLDESSVTQVIETTTATVFPVVADPRFISGVNNWFGGRYVAARFSVSETVRIAGGGGVAAAMGTLVGMVPAPQAVAAGTVLRGVGAAAVVWAGGARVLNECVEIRYYIYTRGVFGLYYSGAANGCK